MYLYYTFCISCEIIMYVSPGRKISSFFGRRQSNYILSYSIIYDAHFRLHNNEQSRALITHSPPPPPKEQRMTRRRGVKRLLFYTLSASFYSVSIVLASIWLIGYPFRNIMNICFVSLMRRNVTDQK